MNGIYSNTEFTKSHFLFLIGENFSKSCLFYKYRYCKVGKFNPLSVKNNFIVSGGCLVRWEDED